VALEIKRILLPTDFSDCSATATRYACELATKFDAELHLLHTLEVHPSPTPGFGMALALPQYVQESRAAAGKALAGALDPQWAAGRGVAGTVRMSERTKRRRWMNLAQTVSQRDAGLAWCAAGTAGLRFSSRGYATGDEAVAAVGWERNPEAAAEVVAEIISARAVRK
jgi:nucleotide-binding universal stress UspA family protein